MNSENDSPGSPVSFSAHLLHLRRVHFGIVVITTGILVVSAVDPTSSLNTAASELVAINQTIRELEKHPDWLSNFVKDQITSSSSLSFSRLEEDSYGCRDHLGRENFFDFSSLSRSCAGDRYFYTEADGVPDDTPSSVAASGVITQRQNTNEWRRMRVIADGGQFSKFYRLSEFKTAWDQLALSTSIHVVLEIAPRVLVFDAPEHSYLPWATEDGLFFRAETYEGPRGRWLNYSGAPGPIQRITSIQNTTSFWHGFRDWQKIPTDASLPERDLGNFTYAEVVEQICERPGSNPSVCRVFVLPVRVQQFSLDDQEHLIQIAQQSNPSMAVRTGTFAVSFPELNAVTQNVDSLPMERLLDHLDSMSQMSGLNFSAFGITVPGNAVVSFGPIFVLVVCLYFLLHARQFNRISRGQPFTRDFPWIGLYGGLFAGLATIGSIALYPIVACVFLLIRYGVFSQDPTMGALWPILANLAVAAISVGNFIEVARLRTRNAPN